ncbi:MAG: segregation/condensation protein A [Clostridia bacterium]|nr:segregation/condensation protein A [Clostridia bacterium]MBP3554825.1 segregation/condensation protein A [Clostridia bacterium]
MEQLVFKMEVFEGPLDLLLSLIAKHKMDIRDIQIAIIFDQYMEYVEEMKRMDMEIAGEFITMASELMYIKSRMLLPKQEEDPREELVRVLMEYKTAKEVAKWLSEREDDFAGRFEKDTDEIKPDRGILENMDARLLTKALEKLLLRMGERHKVEEERPMDKIAPIIKRPIVPVSQKVISVLRFMYRRRSAHFDELFEDATSRSEIVAIFYATLELLKVGRITLQKEVGDVTNSNIILNFNMTHKRDEKEDGADA